MRKRSLGKFSERPPALPASARPTSRVNLPRMLSGLGALALAGCAVGPDYVPPQAPQPQNFINSAQPGVSTDATETRWWRGFRDAELSHLVERAMAHNLDLRIAAANLREARALRLQAEFDLFPTVTAAVSHTDNKRSTAQFRGFTANRKTAYFTTGFDATWELDFFGRVRRNIEASTAELEAAEANRRDVMVSVAAEIARNYFELRGTQHRLAVARKNADNQRATLDLTVLLLEAGRGTELDTSRAREQLNTTLASIPPLEAAVRRAMYRLSVLTGQPPSALGKTLEVAKALPSAPRLVRIGTPEALLRRRPDIRIAERSLAASTAQIGVAVADLFPRVTFNGNVALQARTLGSLGTPGSDSYTFGPSIRWAAFDIGRVRARVRAADARAEADLARYEQSVLISLEETENALSDFGLQQARRDFLRDAAANSEKAAGLARLRYEDGITDFLTVLDAERRLLEAQDQLAQSETAAATALVAVYKALGGGWENATESLAQPMPAGSVIPAAGAKAR
jgi:multidrug efflux system outer membrane protein